MPTVTFPLASDTDDGTGYREAATWAAINTGTFTAGDGTSLFVGKSNAAGTFRCDNFFLRFDTSSLPDEAIVRSATLQLHIVAISDSPDDVEYNADYYDFGGEPSVAGD